MLALYLAYLDDDNDKELFSKMYYSYRKQMVNVALSIINDELDAQDIVEEVFLRIAQKYFDVVRDITDKADLRNYLLKSTKNAAISSTKSNKKDTVSLDTVSEYCMNDIEVPSDDIFVDTVCNKLDYEATLEAIESLNERYREVLYYHFVVGLSVPKTAKLLNQSTATTKKQLVRGKKMLLSLLETKGVEYNANK